MSLHQSSVGAYAYTALLLLLSRPGAPNVGYMYP